jgi:hypothetical protein
MLSCSGCSVLEGLEFSEQRAGGHVYLFVVHH